MPSKSTKKGFKTVSSKVVVQESLAYEDVENEHTITPKAPKSKSKLKSVDKESKKSSSSGSSKNASSDRKRQRTSEDDDRLKEDKHSTSAHKKAKKMKKKRSDQSPSKSTPKKETTIAKKSKHSTDTEKPRPKEVRSQEGAPVAEPTSGAVKTYYPKIVFDHLQLARNLADRDRASVEAKGKSGSSKKRKSVSNSPEQHPIETLTHEDKAIALIEAICSTEQEGLKDYFSSHHSSRDNVLQSLTAVLSQLPDALHTHFSSSSSSPSQTSSSAHRKKVTIFEPELSTREQNQLATRHAYLQKMTDEMQVLQEYLHTMIQLGGELGSSSTALTGIPIPPTLVPDEGSTHSNSSLKDNVLSSQEAEQQYGEHLESMSRYVAVVQRKLSEMHQDLASAREGQDALYDACQQVRFAHQNASNLQESSSIPASVSNPLPPAPPIFVSSRNFEASKGRPRSSQQQHSSAKEAMKKLQRL